MAQLVRDGVRLAYDETGQGDPPLVFVHGIACHRGFWAPQVSHFGRDHRVVTIDLRGHGDSDAPEQPYTIQGYADDLAWTCTQLEIGRPVVVGHSLGGIVTLEFAAAHSERVRAAVLVDSALLPGAQRAQVVRELVAGLRGDHPDATLRRYLARFFGPDDDPARREWILDQAVRTPPHVTRSTWEAAHLGWDDADVLTRCRAPLLYLDAGTDNADLERAIELHPNLVIGRTIGSGHFSPLEVPEQVNAMLDRFLALRVAD